MGREALLLVAVTPFPTAAGPDTPRPGVGKYPGGMPRSKSGEPPQAGQPRAKMGAPWKLYRTIASRRVQSAYLPARKFGRGVPAKGHPPPQSRRDAEGPVFRFNLEAERVTYPRLSRVRIPEPE